MNFLEIQKEYAQLRGELQNGSIAGMNSDEISLMKKNINREIKELANLHPPFLGIETHLRIQAAVTLMASGVYSATGTKDIPLLYDTGANLKKRDIFRLVENAVYKRRVIDVGAATTYDLDHSLAATATTADGWTAYRDTMPLPHYMGDVTTVFFEDGENLVHPYHSRSSYQKKCKIHNSTSEPWVAGINVFTNRFGKDGAEYTFSAACTVTNNSRTVTIKNTEQFYVGDVCHITTASSTESLHTIAGVTTTTGQGTIYLDRSYAGATGGVTLYCNPREYVDYISFYPYPTDEQDVVLRGWLKPHDMIYDTDECIIPDHLCHLVVIGALLRDKLSMEVLTEQWIIYYEKAKKLLHDKKEPSEDEMPKGALFFNSSGMNSGDYPNFEAAGTL